MKTMKFWLLAIFAALILNTGCQKDDTDPDPGTDPDPVKQKAPELTIKVNTFIRDVMEDIYLWYKELPIIDVDYETDSKAYFKKLLYTEDKWSNVTDDVKKLEDSLAGKEKSYGYSLAFGIFSNAPDNYFAIVEYVYPNTPASRAGFVRGDIILQIAGGSITATNLMDLLGGTSITVTKGVLTQQGIAAGQSLSMVAEDLVLNPVLMHKVIEHGGRKIGYLMYTQFISDFNDSLNVAMQYFKNQNITDLVLDLRYNPGGYTTAAQHLCSSVAPLNAVNNSQVLVTYQWNDKYQAYWQSRNNLSQLRIPFLNTVPVKLGLNKLHVLTGGGTASASELTIIGLEPYMEIVTVGDTTYGKYTASITFKPSQIYDNASQYKDFENWGVQPIVIRYANSQGVTNFKNGFAPKFIVRDELLPALPLGSINEPLLKKAIENITGTQVAALKRAEVNMPPYEIIDRGFSKFDEFKRNLPLNDLIDSNTFWPQRLKP
jgi:carboxyl-terminal processing protease